MSEPTVVSLFAGIGGFDLGLERAGFRSVAQVELDPFCQRVLARRWPGVERVGDVLDAPGPGWGQGNNGLRSGHRGAAGFQSGSTVDLLVGGFPCQDLSVAGKRAGLSGARSGLFYEYVRIANALAPTFGLVENVPGLLSSNRGRDFWLVLEGLRECWPVVGWRVVDSQYFGVAQRRRRVFLVGGPTDASVAEILALTEGGGWDSAAGGQAGTDVAYALAAGAGGSKFGSGRDAQDTFVSATLNSGGNNGGFRTDPGEHLVHALTGEGHDASEDGTGRGTPLVAFSSTGGGRGDGDGANISGPVRVGGGEKRQGVGVNAIAGASMIRRLTPWECEILQGFPFGWTCLCTPLEVYAQDPDVAALACRCPDSPRYRALGNAVTVPVITYFAHRIRRQLA